MTALMTPGDGDLLQRDGRLLLRRMERDGLAQLRHLLHGVAILPLMDDSLIDRLAELRHLRHGVTDDPPTNDPLMTA